MKTIIDKLLYLFLICPIALLSQDIGTTEIKVLEGFKASVPLAKRLNQNAIFADTTKQDKTQEYNIYDFYLHSDYELKSLSPVRVKADKLDKLYSTSISLGLGYPIASKINLLYNSKRSKNFTYGLMYDHFNNKISIDSKNAGSSNNIVYAYGKSIRGNSVFVASLDYERKSAYSYGHEILDINSEKMLNRFSYTRLMVTARSINFSKDQLNYKTNMFFSDLNERSENRFHLSSVLTKKIRSYPLKLDVSYDNYSNYNSNQQIVGLESKDVQLISLMPSLQMTRFNIDFNFGLGLNYESESDFDVLPSLTGTIELVKDILLISSGLEFIKDRNTYKSLSDNNLFIHALGTNQEILFHDFNQDLRTTESKEFFINIRNVLGKDEVWHGGFRYGYISNLPFFNNELTIYNRFLVNYADVWQLLISSSYERKIRRGIYLKLNGRYFNWGDQKISHKPKLFIDFSIPINLREKIILEPEIAYVGSQSSFVLLEPEAKYHEYKLDARLYANLVLRYTYSSQLSSYFILNNITNSNNEVLRGYRDIGFNTYFGLIYSL